TQNHCLSILSLPVVMGPLACPPRRPGFAGTTPVIASSRVSQKKSGRPEGRPRFNSATERRRSVAPVLVLDRHVGGLVRLPLGVGRSVAVVGLLLLGRGMRMANRM